MSTKEQYAFEAESKAQGGHFADDCLTLQELAFLTGTTPEIVEQLVDLDLIEPCARSEKKIFMVENIARVRRILRLQRHLQIAFDSMALIFDLLARIDDLERRINELEKG